MNGTPVWLASLSRRSRITDRLVPYARWSEQERADGDARLRAVLDGVGDPQRERLFRMNITLCYHRAISTMESIVLPDTFHSCPAIGLAGGPIEILRETEPGSDSTKPCHAPTRQPLPNTRLDRDPDAWVPIDCGRCPPCLARAALDGD